MMFAASCNDLLDQMPNNSISGSGMWTTEEQVDMGVKGVYAALQRPLTGSGIVGEGVDIGYYGFDVLGMTGQGSYAVNSLFTSGVTPGNERFSFTWKWCYTGIHRANNAIAYIPEITTMNDKKKARLTAECKVLRAFFYTRLNELFGNSGMGVPLYLEPISPSECNRGQSPEADVWAQIIKDLTEAIDEPELPKNKINGDGRISKGAAYAFRGRAYLLTKDYDKAIADFAKVGEMGYQLYGDYKKLFKVEQERCEEMIFSVQYIEEPAGYGSRVQKYCAAFQQGSKDSRGCWTDLQVSPGIVNLYEVLVDDNTVKPFNWSEFIPEWETMELLDRSVYFTRDRNVNGMEIHGTVTSRIQIALDALSSDAVRNLYLPEGNEARIKPVYANRDPRLSYNVITPYSDFLGVNDNSTAEGWYTARWPATNNAKYYFNQASAEPNANPALPEDYYTTGGPNSTAIFYYMHRKFIGEGLEFLRRQDNPIDEPIIRYGDILLMWAEALVEQNKLTEAMAKVKEVRDRVGIPTMAASFADQTTARNYVRDERRRELMGEGVNFFDEMRWRTLKETKFDREFPQNVWGGRTGGTLYQWIGNHYYTWPVPRAEYEMNPNLTRTPGWAY
jgi:hypothetical protein